MQGEMLLRINCHLFLSKLDKLAFPLYPFRLEASAAWWYLGSPFSLLARPRSVKSLFLYSTRNQPFDNGKITPLLAAVQWAFSTVRFSTAFGGGSKAPKTISLSDCRCLCAKSQSKEIYLFLRSTRWWTCRIVRACNTIMQCPVTMRHLTNVRA